MGLLDTIMAGWASPEEQAVVGLGVAIWIPVFLSLMAIIQALSPVAAHHYGAGDLPAIVKDTRQAIWLALGLSLLPAAALPWADTLLLWAGTAPTLGAKVELFLQGIVLGLPAALVFRALTFYSASVQETRPAMVLAGAGLLINAGLNAVLIEGRWGWPALGGAACGWATGIGMWISLGLMAWYVHRAPQYRAIRLFTDWDRPDPARLQRLLRLGLPMGAAQLAEVTTFTGIALMISQYGAVAIAAHQIALNFSALVFMVPMGLSIALSIRVGQALGANDPAQARFVVGTGLTLAALLALVQMLGLLLMRDAIAGAYSPDTEVRALASQLLLYAALWQLADAAQVCANGALRGYHCTLRPMVLMVGAFWLIGIPAGHWFARQGLPWQVDGVPLGVEGYWMGLVAGLIVAATALLILLRARSASATATATTTRGALRDCDPGHRP